MFKKAAVITALVATTAFMQACSRYEENEFGMRIGADGAIKKHYDGPELVCVVLCNPLAHNVVYKSFTDTFTIQSGAGASASGENTAESTQSRQVFLRTQDDKFVESISVSVSYYPNPKASEADRLKLYKEFRADSSNTDTNATLIRDDLSILVTQPLVKAIRGVDAMDVQDRGEQLGNQIVQELQAAVNKRLGIAEEEESPIVIKAVTLAGVGFDPETEAVLRQKVLAGEKAEIAKVAAGAAEEEGKGASAQAEVTAKAYDALKGSVPEEQLSTAVCLDGLRQGRLPEGTSCFPGLTVK